MEVYDEILAILLRAVERLVVNRLEDSAFTDEEDVKGREYFSTLEGLDSILIPAVNLPKNLFWGPLVQKLPHLTNLIIDDLNFIVFQNVDMQQPPPEHGAPYFKKGPSRKKPYWTTECSSFTLSVMANYLKLSEKKFLPKPRPPIPKVLDVIRTNLRWISRCRRDREGWSWTPDTDAHPWPTWTLLDAFDELLRFRKYRNEYVFLKEQCEAVSTNISKSFEELPKGIYYKDWGEKVLQPTENNRPYNVEAALNLIRLILAASIYRTGQEVLPMAECLYKWAFISDFSKREYKYHFAEQADYIYDSALLPYVFRALIVTAHKLKPRLIDNLDECLDINHEVVVNRVYSMLQKDLISEEGEKYAGLWGVRDGSKLTYELYYNERTIEALTDFLVYYKSHKLDVIRPLFAVSKEEAKVGKKKTTKQRVRKKKAKKKKAGKKRDVLSNDIAQYTLWIPKLAKGDVPSQLSQFKGWQPEEMLEFYVYRLFTQVLFMDGTEWGYKKRGEALPDGRITLPDNNKQCLYDAKSSKKTYNLSKAELRKFKDYANAGKAWAKAVGKEVQYFLVIAPSFQGDLKSKGEELQSETGINLVCCTACDLCYFTDKVREVCQNASAVRLIKWRSLLAKGKPLLKRQDFEEIFTQWRQNLPRRDDF